MQLVFELLKHLPQDAVDTESLPEVKRRPNKLIEDKFTQVHYLKKHIWLKFFSCLAIADIRKRFYMYLLFFSHTFLNILFLASLMD